MELVIGCFILAAFMGILFIPMSQVISKKREIVQFQDGMFGIREKGKFVDMVCITEYNYVTCYYTWDIESKINDQCKGTLEHTRYILSLIEAAETKEASIPKNEVIKVIE